MLKLSYHYYYYCSCSNLCFRVDFSFFIICQIETDKLSIDIISACNRKSRQKPMQIATPKKVILIINLNNSRSPKIIFIHTCSCSSYLQNIYTTLRFNACPIKKEMATKNKVKHTCQT